MRLERDLVHESHPANIKADTLVVVLPDYRLPLGRSHEESDILRPGPAAGQHLVRPDLTVAEGTPASKNQGVQIHDGATVPVLLSRRTRQLAARTDLGVGRIPHDHVTGDLTRFDEAS